MSLATRVVEKKITQQNKLDELVLLLRRINNIKQKPVSSPLLQLLYTGKIMNVEKFSTTITYDVERFKKALQEMLDHAEVVTFYGKLAYKHHWTDSKTISKEEFKKITDPLLKHIDIKVANELKFNAKFQEALLDYAVDYRLRGVSVIDEKEKTLHIIAEVRGKSGYDESGYSIYYTGLSVKIEDNTTHLRVFCTCPYFVGGEKQKPTFTSACKHVIAIISFFYPEIKAFIKAGGNREVYESILDEIRRDHRETIDKLSEIRKTNADKAEVIAANLAYYMYRDILSAVNKAEISVKEKIVLPPEFKHYARKLWDSLKPVIQVPKKQQEKISAPEIEALIGDLQARGIMQRIRILVDILNGTQGSQITTDYTLALASAAILGSNLFAEPTIISIIGDPGTGKTLTAKTLAKIIGIRSLVLEKTISSKTVIEDVRKSLETKLRAFISAFLSLHGINMPVDKILSITGDFRYLDSPKKAYTAARALAETMVDTLISEGKVDPSKRDTLITDFASLFHKVITVQMRLYRKYSSSKYIRSVAAETRSRALKLLEELGIIRSAKEKEEYNAGSVRWEVIEKSDGYIVRVYIDTHYLLGLAEVNPKIIHELEAKAKMAGFRVTYHKEVPGEAEIKLSTYEYLFKQIKTRAEDILSRTGKLIWVGGEATSKSLIIIDESRRMPIMLERLLTDLSEAGESNRRTNIVVTTDNAEPVMEVDQDPRLDPFTSRITASAITLSTTVHSIISETLAKVRNMREPLIYMDELYLLSKVAEKVPVPEKIEEASYLLPLIFVYEVRKAKTTDVIFDVVIRGSESSYGVEEAESDILWGDMKPIKIRAVPDRRMPRQVLKLARTIAVIEGKSVVTTEEFVRAVRLVALARSVPLEPESPYIYINQKKEFVDQLEKLIRNYIEKGTPAVDTLIARLSKGEDIAVTDIDAVRREIESNPLAAYKLMKYIAGILVSKERDKFIERIKRCPPLYKLAKMISAYEKIYIIE